MNQLKDFISIFKSFIVLNLGTKFQSIHMQIPIISGYFLGQIGSLRVIWSRENKAVLEEKSGGVDILVLFPVRLFRDDKVIE